MTELESRHPAPRHDSLDPDLFGQTPSQTVGPFFHDALPWKGGADLVDVLDRSPRGEVIELFGRVLDGNGDPVPDAMLEIWQANAAGRYASAADPRTEPSLDPHFLGFGRAATASDGGYRFRTIRPGRVPGPGATMQAPHLAISVFGRGLLKRLATRCYFADGDGNDVDPVLAVVPPDRRHTLIARVRDAGWELDIVLQGPDETVFFDL